MRTYGYKEKNTPCRLTVKVDKRNLRNMAEKPQNVKTLSKIKANSRQTFFKETSVRYQFYILPVLQGKYKAESQAEN